MRDLNLTGVIAGVWVPDQGNYVRARGPGNIAGKRPVLYNDTLRIGSITKTFTTTIILQLVDEGLISLDQTLNAFNFNVPNADQITIRQICNHTSGLYDYSDDPDLVERLFTKPTEYISPQTLINVAAEHPPLFPPGTQVDYNNTGFILQGLIIEQVTGSSLETEILARILTPLNFRRTLLPVSTFLKGEFTRGYLLQPDSQKEDFSVLNPAYSWASGGMISNLLELKEWAKVLALGALISPQAQAQRLTFVVAPDPFVEYGLGIERLGPFLGHEGDIISYNASMNYLPSNGATFVVLVNQGPTGSLPDDNATMIFQALSKILYPDLVPW